MAEGRIVHAVRIPLGRESIEQPSGLPAAGDRTSHEVFIFCGFAQASADRVFIESGPKTAGIRPCLATQREISVLQKKKKCPLLPSPARPFFPPFHSPHVVSLFKSFPRCACTEEESRVFLRSPAWLLSLDLSFAGVAAAPAPHPRPPLPHKPNSRRGFPGEGWPHCSLPGIEALHGGRRGHCQALPYGSELPASPRPQGKGQPRGRAEGPGGPPTFPVVGGPVLVGPRSESGRAELPQPRFWESLLDPGK